MTKSNNIYKKIYNIVILKGVDVILTIFYRLKNDQSNIQCFNI